MKKTRKVSSLIFLTSSIFLSTSILSINFNNKLDNQKIQIKEKEFSNKTEKINISSKEISLYCDLEQKEIKAHADHWGLGETSNWFPKNNNEYYLFKFNSNFSFLDNYFLGNWNDDSKYWNDINLHLRNLNRDTAIIESNFSDSYRQISLLDTLDQNFNIVENSIDFELKNFDNKKEKEYLNFDSNKSPASSLPYSIIK